MRHLQVTRTGSALSGAGVAGSMSGSGGAMKDYHAPAGTGDPSASTNQLELTCPFSSAINYFTS